LDITKEFIRALIDFDKILIAAVNGPAVGIMVTTLTLCDFVYAAQSATFVTPFTRLALCPEGCSSFLFPLLMGYTKANELLLLNPKITAIQAEKLNLITQAYLDKNLIDEVIIKCQELLSLPPESLKISKQLIRGPLRDYLHKVNDLELTQLYQRILSKESTQAISKLFSRNSKL